MKTLRFPLQIGMNGQFSVWEDPDDIVRGQIIDWCLTNEYERTMRAEYGANLKAFLFSPVAPMLLESKAIDIQSQLSSIVTLGEIVNVTMVPSDEHPGQVDMTVYYRIFPDAETRAVRLYIYGLITEETFIE